MFDTFPESVQDIFDWQWTEFEPFAQDLLNRELDENTIGVWLKDNSTFRGMISELQARLRVATTVDTTDEQANERFTTFMKEVYPAYQKFSFDCNRKLVDSGLEPEGYAIALRNLRTDIELFREENIPLRTQESELGIQYNRLQGSQTVEWDGEEKTISQMSPILQDNDRAVREKAWRLIQERMKQDRTAYNDLWRQFMDLRKLIAANADLPDYRAYAWKDRRRFDYTPEDALNFCDAIDQVVVPARARLREKRRQQMQLDALRPWDTSVDPLGMPPLRPYETPEEFEAKAEAIFNQVDPELGNYFKIMRDEKLLDLVNRKGKGPGGYCTYFQIAGRPFIFQNGVGVAGDIRTLLHEAGHAFHGFERVKLPDILMRSSPMEFNEVASMAMELIAAPYLKETYGGYYNESDYARARIEHLTGMIESWPYMAVVVRFQHWIYTHHDEATDPDNCDEKWAELYLGTNTGIDFSGLEDYALNRWRRQLHIFRAPFYYIEYALARLGAAQVWANALKDQAGALAQYRAALALGGTVTLPQLYETAGAKLAFDAETLREAVDLIESTISELETSI